MNINSYAKNMHSNKYFLLVAAFCGLTLSADSTIKNEVEQLSTELDEAELEPKCPSEALEKPAVIAEVETPSADEIGSYAEDTNSNILLKLSIAGLSLALIATASYNPASQYIRSYITYKKLTSLEECKTFVLSLINRENLIYEGKDEPSGTDHLSSGSKGYIERHSGGGYSFTIKNGSVTPEQAVEDIRQYIDNNFIELYTRPVCLVYLKAGPASESSWCPYKELTSEMGAKFYSPPTIYANTMSYVREYVHLVVSDYKEKECKKHQERCSWSNLFKNKDYSEARWR